MASTINKILAVRKSSRISRNQTPKHLHENKRRERSALVCCTKESSSEENQSSPSKINQKSVGVRALNDVSPSADIENSPIRAKGIPLCYPTPERYSNDLRNVCRRILTPSSKRKSDEGDHTPQCSPTKSPRSTEKDETPRSSRRPINGEKCASIVTPRRLFGSPEKASEVSCPLSPPSSTVSNSPIKTHIHRQNSSKSYQITKRSLHTAKPDFLICREKEEEEIKNFIFGNLTKKTSSSLYISGAPGTGKTAVISHIVDKLKAEDKSLRSSFINCMMLHDSNAVFCKLHEELTGQPLRSKDSVKAIEKLITSCKDCILLVLDEIDQLDSKHHEILYRIFEWPALKSSKIVLIGIANALDLTDRILPRLQASKKCKPTLMNFPPYSSTQITEILKNRLKEDSVIEPSAVSFCAKKVAAVAGDMRKALDVCRRAVEMVEADDRGHKVLKPSDCNSPKKNQTPVKKVNITHISKVMSDVYGSSVTVAGSGDNSVPLQQKLAVCSLLLLVKSGKFKEVTLGKLHESYAKVCKRQQTLSVDQGEFHSVLCLLETRGVITLKKAKDTRLMKVSLKLDEQELEVNLKDKALMAAILNNGL